MNSTYLTVNHCSEGTYKEKGSKFIAKTIACYSESEAKIHLETWRKEHPQARHLCYAYRFGLGKMEYRAFDDGEPNNSAGQPILGQIDSFHLTNVLIGVVRYYGGTKLGVGGLINAYRTAAKEALTQSQIIELELTEKLLVEFEYQDLPGVMNIIKKMEIEIEESHFDELSYIKLRVRLGVIELLKNTLVSFNSVKISQ